MKIIIALVVFIALAIMVWITGAIPANQSHETSTNLVILTLSEQLLYRVKTEQTTDSVVNSLSRYSVQNLSDGLPNDNARKIFWINLYNAWYQIFAIRDKKSKDVTYTDRILALPMQTSVWMILSMEF